MAESKTSSVGALAVRYEGNPAIRALLSLIPWWSAADRPLENFYLDFLSGLVHVAELVLGCGLNLVAVL